MTHAELHPCGRYDGARQMTDESKVSNWFVTLLFALTSHQRFTASSAFKLPSSSPVTTSCFSPLVVLVLTLLSTRRRRVVALVHDVRCEVRYELDGNAFALVGDGGAELRGPSPKVLRNRVRMDGSSRLGFDDGRTNVGRIGIEFGVGVDERWDGSDVDATLHRDASAVANPEGYTLSLSVEEIGAVGSGEGVADTLLTGGVRSMGVGVVGDGGGDSFGADMYIACRREDV
jgi:hypothetical protein